MPRRKKRKRKKSDYARFEMTVSACAVRVGRTGPKIIHPLPEGESDTYINIEGTLDRPVYKDMRAALVSVFERDEPPGDPGTAIGSELVWNVICALPPSQFAALLGLVFADKLTMVELLFEDLRWRRARLRSIHFCTAPVPFEREEDEEEPAEQ